MRLHPDTYGEDSVCEVKGPLLPLERLDSGLGHISEWNQWSVSRDSPSLWYPQQEAVEASFLNTM